MAVEKSITVTCDVCGKSVTFNESKHDTDFWRRSVWMNVKTAGREKPYLVFCDMDICDDCLKIQTVLEADADGTVELRDIRNIRNIRNVRLRESRTVSIGCRYHEVTLLIAGKKEFEGSTEELRTLLRQHRKFMDAIDSVPEEGGEL